MLVPLSITDLSFFGSSVSAFGRAMSFRPVGAIVGTVVEPDTALSRHAVDVAGLSAGGHRAAALANLIH
jgi:hypothetical protein